MFRVALTDFEVIPTRSRLLEGCFQATTPLEVPSSNTQGRQVPCGRCRTATHGFGRDSVSPGSC